MRSFAYSLGPRDHLHVRTSSLSEGGRFMKVNIMEMNKNSFLEKRSRFWLRLAMNELFVCFVFLIAILSIKNAKKMKLCS